MFEDSENIPKYFAICANYWSTGRSRGWYFKEESFSEYISADDAYEKILGLKNTDDFSSLKFSFKEITVAYYLWFNSDRKDHNEITKEAVAKIIPEWERKQY